MLHWLGRRFRGMHHFILPECDGDKDLESWILISCCEGLYCGVYPPDRVPSQGESHMFLCVRSEIAWCCKSRWQRRSALITAYDKAAFKPQYLAARVGFTLGDSSINLTQKSGRLRINCLLKWLPTSGWELVYSSLSSGSRMILCLDVCIKQLIKKKSCKNSRASTSTPRHVCEETGQLVWSQVTRRRHRWLSVLSGLRTTMRSSISSSRLSLHLFPSFLLLLHSDLQLPVLNMSGPGPGDWGNCADSGEERR